MTVLNQSRELVKNAIIKQLSENYSSPDGDYVYEYYDDGVNVDSTRELIIFVDLVSTKNLLYYYNELYSEELGHLPNYDEDDVCCESPENVTDRMLGEIDRTIKDLNIDNFYENIRFHFVIAIWENIKFKIKFSDPNLSYSKDYAKFIHGPSVNGVKLYSYERQAEFENPNLLNVIYNTKEGMGFGFHNNDINLTLEELLDKFKEEGLECSDHDKQLLEKIFEASEDLSIAYYDVKTGEKFTELISYDMWEGVDDPNPKGFYAIHTKTEDERLASKGFEYPFKVGYLEE